LRHSVDLISPVTLLIICQQSEYAILIVFYNHLDTIHFGLGVNFVLISCDLLVIGCFSSLCDSTRIVLRYRIIDSNVLYRTARTTSEIW